MRDVGGAGNTAGAIYALSTLGSILGTFIPVFLLLPNAGQRRARSTWSPPCCCWWPTLGLLHGAGARRAGGGRRACWPWPR